MAVVANSFIIKRVLKKLREFETNVDRYAEENPREQEEPLLPNRDSLPSDEVSVATNEELLLGKNLQRPARILI